MAGQFTWSYDVDSGVYKSREISDNLRFAAIADTKVMQFVRTEPGFGKKKGETMTIERIRNITVPGSAVLTEGTRIPVDQFLMSSVPITIQEYGRAVEFTSLANDLSKFDLEKPIQRKLKDQMKLILDVTAMAAFKLAKVCFYATSLTGGTFTVNGTPGGQALQNMTVAHMGVIRDHMQDTLHVPPYEGDDFIGLMSTKALRGIKNDPDFAFWRQYLKPGDVLFNSEVGKVETIRCIEINYTSTLSKSIGAAGIAGEAIIFGEDGVVMIEVETPDLRAAIPGDFGRSKAVAWYGVLAFGLVWDTGNDGEARVYRVTST